MKLACLLELFLFTAPNFVGMFQNDKIIFPWLVCIHSLSHPCRFVFLCCAFAAINHTDNNNSPVNTHNLFTHSTNNSTTSDSSNNLHHLYHQPGSSSSSSSNGRSSSNNHCCGHHPVLVYDSELELSPGIAGYRLTNPSIMAIAPIRASLDVSKQGVC